MFFKKKKNVNVGIVAVIDFTDMAKDIAVGGDSNKRIHILYNFRPTGTTYQYSEAMVKELMSQNIPVHDMTESYDIPKESVFIPSTRLISGRLELRKVLG